MKNIRFILLSCMALLLSFGAFAQEPEGPDTDKMITQQIEALEKLLELDDIQVFYVDSILQADITGLMDELNALRKGGSEYQESYILASDQWMDKIDNAFQKVFTEEQWKKYMKSTYGKEKLKRDKRFEKRSKTK